MQFLRDANLPEPYRAWIAPRSELSSRIRLIPASTDLGPELMRLGTVCLVLLVPGCAIGFVLWDRQPDWRSEAAWLLGGILFVLSLPVLIILRNVVLILQRQTAKARGGLRMGIFVGTEGVLIRLRPNDCRVIPQGEFLGALSRKDDYGRFPRSYFRVESTQGSWECEQAELAGTPRQLNEWAESCWKRTLPPVDPARANALSEGRAPDTWLTLLGVIVVRCLSLLGATIGAFAVACVPGVLAPVVTAIRQGDFALQEYGVRLTAAGFLTFAGSLFAIAFGGVLLAGLYRDGRKRRYPAEPWLWRADWAAQRITDPSPPASLLAAMVLALFVLLVTPLCALFSATIGWGVWIFWCFAGLICYAIAVTFWKNRHLQAAVLWLDTLPGQLGGTISGRVEIPRNYPESASFRVELLCAKFIRRDSSTTTTLSDERTVWSIRIEQSGQTSARRFHATDVGFQFEIPFDQPPTDPRDQHTFRWYVKVGPTESPELYARIEVPVFRVNPTPTV